MKRRRPSRSRRIGATLVFAALAVTPGLAAAGWTPPQDVSLPVVPATVPTNAQVAVDGAGNATAVWTELTPTDSFVNTATRVSGSATWSTPETLSTTGSTVDPMPQIAVNAAGAVVGVWTHFNGQDQVVQSRSKTAAAGSWSAAQDLSTSVPDPVILVFDEGEARSPQIGIAGNGTAVATWVRNNAANAIVQASRLSGGTWGSPADVSATGSDGDQSRIGVDATGNATAVWVDSIGGHRTIRSSRLPTASNTWSAPQSVSELSADTSNPQLAVNPGGDATTVWVTVGLRRQVQSASRSSAGATWTSVDTLTPPDAVAADPQVGIDAGGSATAVWSQIVGGNALVQSRRRTSGTWSATASLSAAGSDALTPDLAVNGAGAASAVWVTGQNVVQSSTIAVASPTWSAPTPRSLANANCDRPSVAMNAAGRAVAVWTTDSGIGGLTQASLFDVTPPSIIAMNVPARGETGTPVAMSATVADNGSGLGPTSWDFGDGTRATARDTTAHTYANPGTFTVTLTPVNSFGGSATQQRQIAITQSVAAPAGAIHGAKVKLSKVSGSCVRRPRRICQARVAFRLNIRATVTLTIRTSKGKVIGTITRRGRAGANVVLIPAKIGARAITAGRYRVTIRAKIPTAVSKVRATGPITVR